MNFRIVFVLFISLAVFFLAMQARLIDRSFILPGFLKHDPTADKHSSAITVTVQSGMKPNDAQLGILKTNYDALWAHLNLLYSNNDVEEGKEYYTEEWFRLICRNNPKAFSLPVTRRDLTHSLYVVDWSADGLVCAAIDSNVNMLYTYRGGNMKDSLVYTRANFAITLLFQGDHWRIDGMHLLDELPAVSGHGENRYGYSVGTGKDKKLSYHF